MVEYFALVAGHFLRAGRRQVCCLVCHRSVILPNRRSDAGFRFERLQAALLPDRCTCGQTEVACCCCGTADPVEETG